VRRSPSLALRTVGYLVVSQILAFVVAWIITTGLGLAGVERFATAWDDLAYIRTTKLVVDSLVMEESGLIRIEPTTELQTEMRRAPALKFAAFKFATGTPIPGSSPELIATLEKLVKINPTHSHFVLPGDRETRALGFMGPVWTRFGKLQIATYRLKFRWDDIFHTMRDEFYSIANYLIAAVLLSAATGWFAVRRGMTPLRAAAAEATRIDMKSLDQRLSSKGIPEEVIPFVDAVNQALSRLDAGASRQRRFSANAAHELRTPLAIMRARLENAQESSLRNDLLSDASQLRAIVEQMLIATRLGENQAGVDEEVDLTKTIRGVVSGALWLAIERNRMIELEASSAPVIVRGNRRAFECVVTNLVDNALRAEPTGGVVLVSIGDGGMIAIVDHGEGVAPENREIIFEPFWRKSESTPGTGLGLAIAKEIVELHGGRIWVEETPGGGATFTLLFPQR
jgi:two-component system, OmpR family, sensor kinase